MPQQYSRPILDLLPVAVLLRLLVVRNLELHLVLQVFQVLLFLSDFSVNLGDPLEVILFKNDLPPMLDLGHFVNLLSMKHVGRALVIHFDPEEALLELAPSVKRAVIGVSRDDRHIFVEDAIAVCHALVNVRRLLDQFLELFLLFA